MNKKKMSTMSRAAASGPHPITLLPKEILGIIFNKIKQKEVYKLRLVCKQWNEDVKDFYKFFITLNEDSLGLDFVLQLRISRLDVKRLVQKRISILPVAAVVPTTEGRQLRSQKGKQQEQQQLTFKHPNVMRRITVDNFFFSEPSNMKLNDVKELLQLFQKPVTRLELGLNSTLSKQQFPSTFTFQFLNLKRLDLIFELRTDLFRNNSVLRLLQMSEFPRLRFLKVQFYDVDEVAKVDSAVSFVLTLLTKNLKGLERLNISLFDFEHMNASEEVKNFSSSSALEVPEQELVSLKTLSGLKWLKFHVDFAPASTSTNQLLQLISRQRKLEKFYPGRGFPCSPTLLKSIMMNNLETIVEVNIQVFNVSPEAPFDISVLNNCEKLKYLFLEKNASVGTGPELINAGSFPAAIISLSFEGIRILSRDLLALLNSDLMLTLERLSLDGCGNSGDCGVNLAVLKKNSGAGNEKVILTAWKVTAY